MRIDGAHMLLAQRWPDGGTAGTGTPGARFSETEGSGGLRVAEDGAQAEAASRDFAQGLIERFDTQSHGLLAEADGAVVQASGAPRPIPETVAETVAAEVARRSADTPTGERGGGEEQAQALADELAGTMDFIRGRFGRKAATAAMALVMEHTAGGADEDSLGRGLVEALKLVERDFGPEGGDALMAHLNTRLNPAINAYFDNGATEVFLARNAAGNVVALGVTGDSGSQEQVIDSLAARESGADALSKAVDEALGSALQALREDLEAAGEAAGADPEAAAMRRNPYMTGLSAGAATTSGTLLDAVA